MLKCCAQCSFSIVNNEFCNDTNVRANELESAKDCFEIILQIGKRIQFLSRIL